MIAQDYIHEVGLAEAEFVGCAFDEFFVGIRDDNQLVFFWKGPRAHIAIQGASLTCIAFDVITLLAKRLPVSKVIATISGTRNFMVWTEIDFRFLQSAVGALVPVLLLQSDPIRLRQLRPWLALLTHVKALQLIADAFLFNRSESLFALQFSHSAKYVLVGVLPVVVAPSVNSDPNISSVKAGPGMPCPGGQSDLSMTE
jgi:hypothetical protein